MTQFDKEILKRYSTHIMMKKVVATVLFVFSLLLLSAPLYAQETSVTSIEPQIYPAPPYRDNPRVLGHDHAYSVTFRGNGEAVVSAKVVFTNLTENPLNTMSLRVPKVDAKDVIVFQVLQEKTCIGGYQQQSQEVRPGTPLVCNQYQDPDYYGYYGNSKYQKAQSELHGDTIDITLPQPVKTNGSGAFLVYYRVFGYAKKNLFGAYTFTFETLKVEDKIRNLTVGISTDSDLVLKGAKGKVNYRFNEASMMALKSSDAGVAMASPQFDQYYQQIGYGTITKNASNLQPLDSYTVKGAYAENSLRLYGKEVTIAIVVLFAFIAICIYLGKKLLASLSGPKKSDSKEVNTIAPYLSAVGVGFVASFFILAYTIGLFVLHAMLRELFGYDNTLFFINMLVGLLSLAIYAFLLFVPSLVMGFKKGSALGIGTFAATVVCVFFELIVALLMLFALSRNGRPPYEIFQSMMGGGMMRANVEGSTEAVPMMEQTEESSGATQQLPQ